MSLLGHLISKKNHKKVLEVSLYGLIKNFVIMIGSTEDYTTDQKKGKNVFWKKR